MTRAGLQAAIHPPALSSFYFDVEAVDETHTKAKKTRYVAEAFATFERLLGNVRP